MNLIDRYQQEISSGKHREDPAQKKAISSLQAIHDALEFNAAQQKSLLSGVFSLLNKRRPQQPSGLYLWGDVGRGKTWLMNLFYECLPFENKQRLHFHHFMLEVHERLGHQTNQKNPLKNVAKELTSKYRVLCLDEFIVTNITDAMLLYGLLEELFNQGMTLIMTSNRVPDDLYLNGLQRERFLPAIELIKNHTQVMCLGGNIDHRLALLEQSDIYYTPITVETDGILEQRLQSLATDRIEYKKTLQIHSRPIKTIACADEIAWFDFDALCDAPRAAQDYIILAQEFHTIVLSNVPEMDEYLDDKARRFIYLIDELYDKSVKLILSAAKSPEKLYTGKMLKFPFNRTSSRLIEMRTEAYLSKPHDSQYDR